MIPQHFEFAPPVGRNLRPSAGRIIAAWKRAGRPDHFTVAYGETFAEFERYGGRWDDTGNGCRGVDRLAVVRALTAECAPGSIMPGPFDKVIGQ
jgi:hypothetical protein